MEQETKKKNIFSLKNIFFVIIILSLIQPFYIAIKQNIEETLHPNTYVGTIKINGLITDPTHVVTQIYKFLKEDRIKAILLKINSPGGAPGASQAIANELKKFKLKKPVIAMIGDLGASGAYYIASAADKIISNPSSLVGSIGVIAQLPNVKEFLNYHNISVKLIQSGKFKTLSSPLKEITPEEMIFFQNVLDDTYNQFTKDVAESRKLNLKNREVWADGKIFTGNQALKLNLIDKVGSISDAKDMLKEVMEAHNLKVEGEIKLVYPKSATGLSKLLYGETEDNEEALSNTTANFISSVYNKVLTLNAAQQPIMQ